MIEIKHLQTGEVLHTVDADTLQGADLRGLDLQDANLNGADLRHSLLRKTDMSKALLSGASLHQANLIDANLCGAVVAGATLNKASLAGANLNGTSFLHASLFGVDLTFANLTAANLIGADLSEALLFHTVLTGVDLSDTRFSRAIWGYTLFNHCYDLHKARGLEDIVHNASSSLDVVTLRNSLNDLPEVLLQGVGYTSDEIENLRGLYGKSIQYYSCFLSHAGCDNEFADKLHNDLRNRGISCWHHRHDMHGGDFWRKQINAAIRYHDKLIVVCSEDGLLRANVVDEIIEGMEQERESGIQKLFPIRLDNFIFSQEMEQVIAFRLPLQQRKNWTRYLREYHIPDFTRWKDHDAYQMEFKKLLNALKHPQQR